MRFRLRRMWLVFSVVALTMGLLPAPASAHSQGWLTTQDPFITLKVPGTVQGIITVGESINGFTFEGIPDGIGAISGEGNTVDVYVAHEQSTVAFPPLSGAIGPPLSDFEDASVSKIILDRDTGAFLSGEVVIPSSAGFLRFCSAFLANRGDGFPNPFFFVNEESNDVVDVPEGATYGADPSLAGQRQAGYVVVYDTVTGEFKPIPGMGRLNHENTIVVPGRWDKQRVILTTDDTFSGPSAQLYEYIARNAASVWADTGSLWAFRVTGVNGVPIDPLDPFNGANDYLDLDPGESFQGEFIRVPDDIADGTTGDAPQTALEDWSNANNVFQFLRLEDLATNKSKPRVVYIADTGRTRVIPDPATGRLMRGPSGTVGLTDNGRIFKMVLNRDNPNLVNSLTIFADGDSADPTVAVPFLAPDNIDTSRHSLMVQEDNDNARIWRYNLATGVWDVVATVNDPDGESSGIIDASQWFGPGAWLLDVQSHGVFQKMEVVPNPDDPGVLPDLTKKREAGQLILMTIPGS